MIGMEELQRALIPTPLNTFGINWTADVPQVFLPGIIALSIALVAKWTNNHSYAKKLREQSFQSRLL